MSQRGSILPILLIILVLLLGAAYFVVSGKIQISPTPRESANTQITSIDDNSDEARNNAETITDNPFDTADAYSNPFLETDNPFENLK